MLASKRREPLPTTWELPGGWTWGIVRVIHCLPDGQVDGWRVTLCRTGNVVIEVMHRSAEHARVVAIDAAAELYPGTFKRYQS